MAKISSDRNPNNSILTQVTDINTNNPNERVACANKPKSASCDNSAYLSKKFHNVAAPTEMMSINLYPTPTIMPIPLLRVLNVTT